MNPNALLDPQYAFFLTEPSSDWTLANLPAIRARIAEGFKPSAQARCEQHWISHPSLIHGLRVCLYRPQASDPGATIPAVLYLHGGGYVLGRPEMLDDYLAELATDLGALVVAVDYRLAPEHPFPAPLDDCYAGLAWLCEHSAGLGVDPAAITLMGHSAGGGLAAALAIMARDRGVYPVQGTVLIYPMLDHRTGQPGAGHANPTTGHLAWSRPANQFCWACYQGDYRLEAPGAALFSPALARDLRGLPPTFICVGALDLFLEECMDFALRLSAGGVATELHVYPGVPHLFDLYPGRLTDQCRTDLLRAFGNLHGPGR